MVRGFLLPEEFMVAIATPLQSKRDDGLPRRADLSLWNEAERAIYDALQKVEMLGADPLLTDAVILLGDARDKVADWLEGKTGN